MVLYSWHSHTARKFPITLPNPQFTELAVREAHQKAWINEDTGTESQLYLPRHSSYTTAKSANTEGTRIELKDKKEHHTYTNVDTRV